MNKSMWEMLGHLTGQPVSLSSAGWLVTGPDSWQEISLTRRFDGFLVRQDGGHPDTFSDRVFTIYEDFVH